MEQCQDGCTATSIGMSIEDGAVSERAELRAHISTHPQEVIIHKEKPLEATCVI